MKLLILADVHSNVECLKAIWAREKDADAICMAGDLVDYGTDPAGAIRWLRERGARAVYGNHDRRALDIWRENRYRDLPREEFCWVH